MADDDDVEQQPSKRARQGESREWPCLHHHVLLSFKTGVSGEAISAAVAAADGLTTSIPIVISVKLAPIITSQKGFSHQLLVVLGCPNALEDYEVHPANQAFLRDVLDPLIEEKITYTVPATRLMGKLSGKVALITGSSSGIGKEVAIAYAREGCDVVINHPTGDDSQAANAAEVAKTISQLGCQTLIAAADITIAAEVQAMVSQVIGTLGRIDILVNNAGMASSATVDEMPEDMWDTMLRVNLKGLFLCTRAVLPHMYERDYGKIINTASQLAYLGAPGFAHYTATKGAVLSFTRSVALEIGKRNVRINAVAPGATRTPILANVPDEVIKGIEAGIPRGRLALPSEIAPAYVFLASDENDAFVGQCLSPNGGDAFL